MPTAACRMESGTVEGPTLETSILPPSTVSPCFPGQPNTASLEAAFSASSSASFLVNTVDRGVFLLPTVAWAARELLEHLGLHTGVLTDAHSSMELGPKRV